MGQIVVQGQRVTVGDNFFKLPREEQENAVDEIAAELRARGGGGRRGSAGKPRDPSETPVTLGGTIEQALTGLAKGAIAAPGVIMDVAGVLDRAGKRLDAWVDSKPNMHSTEPLYQPDQFGGSGYLVRKADELLAPPPTIAQTVTGEKPQSFLMRQPGNTAEEFGDTVGQFVGGSYLGPGSRGMKVLSGATGGLASETAGQVAREIAPDYEGAVRFGAGAVGASIPTIASAIRGRNVPRNMTAAAMGGIDEATLDQAFLLRQMAAREGIDLSWPESIEHVSNGATRLTDLQRVVENSTRGGPVMREFYAGRPEQIDLAAARQFDAIAPNPMTPERLGPRVQQAAESMIDDTTAEINRRTRPMYRAAEGQQIPANHPALQDPAYLQAVREIRNDPVLGPRFANHPDNSIAVVDAAQKIMRSTAEGLRVPGQGMNPYRASLTSQARRQVTSEARNQSPQYATAVQQQRQLREQHLNPLEQGPTGRLAATSDVGSQTKALFPTQPQARSEAGVARAMRGIGRRDPAAAEGIIRQHLETRFAEATQRTQAGQNPYGGAKFSAIVAGNPQQRRNLFQAVRALPNGALLWRGFSRFLDVLEATGKRPAPNSMTQFNAQLTKELEQGGAVGEAAAIAASPQKAFSFIKDRYAQFRLGRGTEQLARLFTQGNLGDFRVLLNQGPATPRVVAIIVRLLAQAGAGTSGRIPASQPVQ